MNKRKKTFDCVEMKNRIQSQLLKKWDGKTDAQIRREIYQELQNSKSTVAQFWRKIRSKDKAQSFVETT